MPIQRREHCNITDKLPKTNLDGFFVSPLIFMFHHLFCRVSYSCRDPFVHCACTALVTTKGEENMDMLGT